jgi:hypothetical protein
MMMMKVLLVTSLVTALWLASLPVSALSCDTQFINDQLTCNTACGGDFGGTGTYDGTSCACVSSGFTSVICGEGSVDTMTMTGTTSTSDIMLSYSQVLDFALAGAPAQCHDAIRSAFSRGLYNCITDTTESMGTELFTLFSGLENFELGSDTFAISGDNLDDLCENVCFGEYVNAFGALFIDAPQECLATFGDELFETVDFSGLAEFKPLLQTYCATGGDGRCGEIAVYVNEIIG